MRSFLPKHLRNLFKKKETSVNDQSRTYSHDTEYNREAGTTRGDLDLARQPQLDRERENLFHWQSLSPREKEVVALVCMGQRNYQIAETLGIAHGTVKSHLVNIFKKFNLRDRHAIRLALRDW
ncbi:MAG: LuxR C-terminal-related transcriptional regulator, partial [Ignavibacteria bacterium]|nr:LuxR C-terminal-related transcriptional regulator [Ignavibacteria bacterium]